MPSGRTNNSPESGRGLGHVTPTTAVRSAILVTAWLLVITENAVRLGYYKIIYFTVFINFLDNI